MVDLLNKNCRTPGTVKTRDRSSLRFRVQGVMKTRRKFSTENTQIFARNWSQALKGNTIKILFCFIVYYFYLVLVYVYWYLKKKINTEIYSTLGIFHRIGSKLSKSPNIFYLLKGINLRRYKVLFWHCCQRKISSIFLHRPVQNHSKNRTTHWRIRAGLFYFLMSFPKGPINTYTHSSVCATISFRIRSFCSSLMLGFRTANFKVAIVFQAAAARQRKKRCESRPDCAEIPGAGANARYADLVKLRLVFFFALVSGLIHNGRNRNPMAMHESTRSVSHTRSARRINGYKKNEILRRK